jgi:thymidylate synthase ThyX
MPIEARVICDSVSEAGKRITTFKLRYPKFIHGELMTHRMLSRNASSSRAVPVRKLLEEVGREDLRAAPVFWGKNQPGMQAAEELEGKDLIAAKSLWEEGSKYASTMAAMMNDYGTHKQIVNRLLEPFSHINVVATATEWDNFFGLRLHKDAQPEMRALAEAMWKARSESIPEELLTAEWHLPFVGHHDFADAQRYSDESAEYNHSFGRFVHKEEVLLWVSTARCARVSYENFETGKASTIEADIVLFRRLLQGRPVHASPAEHQATPDRIVGEHIIGYTDNEMASPVHASTWAFGHQHKNFVGWRQHRAMIPGEAMAPLPEGYP